MTRYIKQSDIFRCGPIALVNALKWSGTKVSYKKTKKLWDKRLRTTFPGGTYTYDFNHIMKECKRLKQLKFASGYKLYKWNIKDVDEHLDNGGAIIFSIRRYMTEKEKGRYKGAGSDGIIIGHYFICIGRTKHFYTLVNAYSSPPAVNRRARHKFIQECRVLRGKHPAYFIKK